MAGYVVEEGKGLVLAVNKWDLVEEKTGRTFAQYVSWIRREAPFLDFAPVVSISAKTGQRVDRVLELAVDVWGERRKRIATGELNRLFAEAVARQAPPTVRNRRPEDLLRDAGRVAPPTFVFFTNDAELIHFSYRRYLENRLRDERVRWGADPAALPEPGRGSATARAARREGAGGCGVEPSRGRVRSEATRGEPALEVRPGLRSCEGSRLLSFEASGRGAAW